MTLWARHVKKNNTVYYYNGENMEGVRVEGEEVTRWPVPKRSRVWKLVLRMLKQEQKEKNVRRS